MLHIVFNFLTENFFTSALVGDSKNRVSQQSAPLMMDSYFFLQKIDVTWKINNRS